MAKLIVHRFYLLSFTSLILILVLVFVLPPQPLTLIAFFMLLFSFILSVSLIFLRRLPQNLLLSVYLVSLPLLQVFNQLNTLNIALTTLLFISLYLLFQGSKKPYNVKV